jgi:hypothetical protein
MIEPLEAANDTVRRLLMEVLLRNLDVAALPLDGVDAKTPLMELGVIDSQGLLDIILEVEDRCGLVFDPLRIDLESGVTLDLIATAFADTPP